MGINPSDLNLNTPLIKYLATAIKNGSQMSKNGDIRMSQIMSRRFAIGIDENRNIYVGMQSDESFLFQEFIITEVAFARNISNSDWLVISTSDASNGRGKDIRGKVQRDIPIRFWFPATRGLFDGFAGIDESKIVSLIEMNFVNNHPEASGSVFSEVPLKLRGSWSDVESIEEIVEDDEIIERFAPSGKDDILAGEDNLNLGEEIPDDLQESLNVHESDLYPDDL